MKKRNLLIYLLVLIMASMTFTACGSNKKDENNTETKTESKLKIEDTLIGLVTNEGGLNDKSFNQSADAGVKKAEEEFGINYKAIESESKEDYQENLEALVDEEAELVLGISYSMSEAVRIVAENNTDKKFVIVDDVIDLQNVNSIIFKEHEGSFLMGVLAGKMTKTNKVGFIGGKDLPVVNKFEAGFAAGVMSVNPEAGKALIERSTVKYAESFKDINKGYEIGQALYGEGCDIIYHAAGGVGIGMFTAAKELRAAGKDVWAIGVDMDQAEGLPEYKDVILSSMVKRVDVGTYNAVKEVLDGEFKGGKIVELGLDKDGVGIAPSTKNNTPQEVIDIVEKYRNAVIDGEIEVPSSLEELKNFEAQEIQ